MIEHGEQNVQGITIPTTLELGETKSFLGSNAIRWKLSKRNHREQHQIRSTTVETDL